MKALLLDFGSSFVKYSFYDIRARVNTDIFAIPFPDAAVCQDGCYEVDREKIVAILWRIMDHAVENGCTAVFICVQMHGYLLQNGDHFSDYISWKDRRGQAYLSSMEPADLFEKGTAIKANLPLVSLQTYGDLSGRQFFTLGSYLAYLLTGNNITHITDACASGFFNATVCGADCPFTGLLLPLAVKKMKPCGTYRGMDIYPPMGDHQVSFLGTNARKGEATLNLGTAAQLSTLVDESAERFDSFEYRPYFGNGRRLMTVTGMCGADTEGLISHIKGCIKQFGDISRILISGGGAAVKYSLLRDELRAMGYKTELCEQNVGNEGMKRIAHSVYPFRGTMLSEIEFVNFPFVMKKSNLDFFIIDNEHGSFESKTVSALAMNAMSAGIQAIVRLPSNDRALITKLADGGARGFLLPMTNRKEDIEKVVEYAKYAPEGKRGISTTRAHTGYGVADLKAYMRHANEQMKVYAQIETRLGVENIEDILQVAGVEGIFIGPNDLSCDFDCMDDRETIKDIVSVICKSCIKHGKPCGIITTDKELIQHSLLNGCSMVSYGSEINMLKKGAEEIVNEKYV